MKHLKEDRTLVFRKKGNKRQLIFNDNVKDQLDAVGKHLECFEPLSEAQQESLQKVKEELQKGLLLIAARQK